MITSETEKTRFHDSACIIVATNKKWRFFHFNLFNGLIKLIFVYVVNNKQVPSKYGKESNCKEDDCLISRREKKKVFTSFDMSVGTDYQWLCNANLIR